MMEVLLPRRPPSLSCIDKEIWRAQTLSPSKMLPHPAPPRGVFLEISQLLFASHKGVRIFPTRMLSIRVLALVTACSSISCEPEACTVSEVSNDGSDKLLVQRLLHSYSCSAALPKAAFPASRCTPCNAIYSVGVCVDLQPTLQPCHS